MTGMMSAIEPEPRWFFDSAAGTFYLPHPADLFGRWLAMAEDGLGFTLMAGGVC
jgi:hypothetical protein